eukprot:TRINITY_DN9445_c0_g3_i1.p1 TRINITY_DN9445_c0_g3~~TRINITY_DN9445_c0_g3_i1.p1  ORF type:complete len:104 (-),score=16.29 TRINITY_DN9445_c0_g3_i1:258-569(-)
MGGYCCERSRESGFIECEPPEVVATVEDVNRHFFCHMQVSTNGAEGTLPPNTGDMLLDMKQNRYFIKRLNHSTVKTYSYEFGTKVLAEKEIMLFKKFVPCSLL